MSDEEPAPSPIMQSDPMELVRQASNEGLARWSDDRRKEFAGTFSNRVGAARYILSETARQIVQIAASRKFISVKHTRSIVGLDDLPYSTPGERSMNELAQIAKERAESVLAELPPLKKAVQMIDPKTAERITARDALIEKGQKLADKMEEFSQPIDMADLDQKMSIGEFRKMVADREKKRRDTLAELNRIGAEGIKLEDQINRALYEGLPGLSDAVVDVVKQHIERVKAMEQMGRRVHEQVMFGDSEAAMSILSGFEKDEAQLSDGMKVQFRAALDKLKLASRKR